MQDGTDLNKKNEFPDNYSFTLLREEATDTDSFEDKTHEKIAETLYKLIKNEKRGATIGLEGPWGSGKSVVISILRKELKDEQNISFFSFDAWAHEGDPLRRIFLESLIEEAFPHKDKDIKELQAKIAKRIKHRDIHSTTSATGFGKLLAISVFFVPLGISLMSKVEGLTFELVGKPHWLFLVSLFFVLSAIWVLIGRFIYLLCKKLKKYSKEEVTQNASENKNSKKIFTAENWAFMQGESKEKITQEVSEDEERSSIEFENYFQKIIEALFNDNPEKKLVMVIDNLDRIDAQDSLKIWSTLQTFLQQRNTPTYTKDWFEKIWIIVPYDPDGLAKLWNKDGNGEYKPFFDKCFQLKFDVPRPILTTWEQFAQDKINEALSKWDKSERKKVLDILRLTRKTLNDIPTPRQIKNYINQVGLLKMHSSRDISTESIAYYVIQRILENQSVDEIRRKLLSGELPKKLSSQFAPESCSQDMAGLIFGVSPLKGQQFLLEPDIQKALESSDGEELKKLQEKHSNGFWAVFSHHIRNKLFLFENLLSYSKAIHDGLWKTFKDRLGVFSKRATTVLYESKEIKWPKKEDLNYYSCLSVVLNNSDPIRYLYEGIIRSLNSEIEKNKQFDMTEALGTLRELVKIFKIDKPSNLPALTIDKFIQWSQTSVKTNIPAWSWIVPKDSLADQISGKIPHGNIIPPGLRDAFVYLVKANSSENWSGLVTACQKHIQHNNGNRVQNSHSAEVFEILFILAFNYDNYDVEIRNLVNDWRFYNLAWHFYRQSPTPQIALLFGKYLGKQLNQFAPSQEQSGNFTNGLKGYWNNRNKNNANAIFNLLKEHNKWIFLWDLAEDSKNKLVVDIILLALKDDEARTLFQTNNGLRKIKLYFDFFGDNEIESVNLLVKALIDHSPLEKEIIGITELNIIEFSEELYNVVINSSNSQLITHLAKKLKEQSKDEWSNALKNDTYLTSLAIAIKEQDPEFSLDNDYANAFIDFVKSTSKGTDKLKDQQKDSWKDLVSLMSDAFQIQYKRDLTRFLMDEYSKVSDEFIEINNEYFDCDKILQNVETVQDMLKDALDTKNIVRLKWLNESVSNARKKFKPQRHFPELVKKLFEDLLKQEQGNQESVNLIKELANKFQVELEKPDQDIEQKNSPG